MKCRIKQEKGITITTLVVTIITLLILTGTLIYNTQDSINIKKLTNLYNDIELLRDKVSIYYNEYGKIPAEIKYTNTTGLTSLLSTKNDTGDFYVIDLEAMQGITLNYGTDYKNVKNNAENADNYTDLYIINENSHNIFYVRGVEINKDNTVKIYYTDYTEPDNTTIDLRYIDGILIPDGYYYIGKTKDNGGNESIVISNTQGDTVDTNKTNQYTWTKQITKIESKPSSITLDSNQKEYQFVKSVNTYKGYFKNSEGKVQYIVIDEENWSEMYTKEVEYEDKNGDKVTIPKGFRVSMSPTMNTIENGLVVKDSNDNEWVWVVVPSSVFITTTKADEYDNIKTDLITYAKDYREGAKGQDYNWTDEWYDGCGIVAKNGKTGAEIYTEMYNKMLSSVYKNKGFWISRYEIGDSTATANNATRTSTSETTGVAVSKKNQIPYNYVTVSQAQNLASGMSTDSNKTSSLLFGIQWDLTCKFLERNSDLTYEDIGVKSSDWGNCLDSTLDITSISAKKLNSTNWINTTETKEATQSVLLTTGASEQTNKMNIYDFAGNEYEWTLEKTSDTSNPCAHRGGGFDGSGSVSPASCRYSHATGNNIKIGFRSALY